MRSIPGTSLALTLLVCGLTMEAAAQDRYILNQNQTGLALPGVNVPNGFDEIRTADGVTCHSSNTGNGAYADVGVIGANDTKGSMNNGAVYGRVVVPLGANGSRLDCRKLYELELERLKMEVRLLKAGLGSQQVTDTDGTPLTTGSTAAAKETVAPVASQPTVVRMPKKRKPVDAPTAVSGEEWLLRGAAN